MKLRFYLRGLGIGIVFSAMICSFGKTNAQETMSDEDVMKRAKELGMVEGTVLSQQGEIDADYTAMINEANEIKPDIFDETVDKTLEETEPLSLETKENIEENREESPKESKEDNTKEDNTEEGTKENTEEIQTEDTVAQQAEIPMKDSNKEKQGTNEIQETKKDGANTKEENTDIKEENADKKDTVMIEVRGGSGSYTVALDCEAAGLVSDAKEFDTYLCTSGYSNRIGVGTFYVPVGSDYESIAKILTRTK